jgi:predicted ATPase
MIPRIRLVHIKNYKSLADVSVELGPFTVLVGPNGSGKSNFVDALSFVQECLSESVATAFQRRGGMFTTLYRGDKSSIPEWTPEIPLNEWLVLHRQSEEGTPRLSVRLKVELKEDVTATYFLGLGLFPNGTAFISRERCLVEGPHGNRHEFEVDHGEFVKPIEGIAPVLSLDRAALSVASATLAYRPLYDFLVSMRVYAIVPGELRKPQDPEMGFFLKRDGCNAAAVLNRLPYTPNYGPIRDFLIRFLGEVAEGSIDVQARPLGLQETIFVRQKMGSGQPEDFPAASMSDGTLRALGIFLALYQAGQPQLVAIEEPEATVHPALAEMLMEVLMNASEERQVLVTTHSPDLLNYKEMRDDQIRLVARVEGKTVIVPPSGALRDVMREHLYSPGELLSMGELHPDEETLSHSTESVDLFGPSLPESHGEQ